MGRLQIKIGTSDFTSVLVGSPVIKDMVNGCCRTLTFSVEQVKNPQRLLSYEVELWYNGVRWFKGEIKKIGDSEKGTRSFIAHDPLFYAARNPDDYYYKKQTGTQIIKSLAKVCGIPVSKIANMGYTFPYLYYKGSAPDKIITDVIARTYAANGKKFWFRYDPVADGLKVFERKVPDKMWAFTIGNNIVSASKEESVEEMCTVVKVINRENGKSVIKEDATQRKDHGKTQYFEEVNKSAGNLDKYATSKLKEVCKISSTMSLTGVNPNGQMKQFYSGDWIYVEEPNTGLAGGYCIKNVTHTFIADDCVQLGFDLVASPALPMIQFSDADKKK